MIQSRILGRIGAAACVASVVAGCSTLPRSGPDDDRIKRSAAVYLADVESCEVALSGRTPGPLFRTSPSRTFCSTNATDLNYALIDISRTVVAYAEDPGRGPLFRTFGDRRQTAPEIRVGVGDVVQVSVFESSGGGLFIPSDAGSRPGNYVVLPQQAVDRSGFISVPYAGQVQAAGRSLPQIQAEIEARLANRAIEPQAIVALVNQRATEVAVVGEVNAPNTLAINPAGDRILDVIARSGGVRCPGYDAFVTLQRNGRKETAYLSNLIESPSENIFVLPEDTIYVYCEPRTFLAFGASGLNGIVPFGQERLSLAEGVAKAGGLLDARADPGYAFVYRIESRATLERLGLDLSSLAAGRDTVPTIYRANFREPEGFFLAKSFPLRDGDILYVSNADSIELGKFLDLIRAMSSSVSGVASDVIGTRNAVRTITR